MTIQAHLGLRLLLQVPLLREMRGVAGFATAHAHRNPVHRGAGRQRLLDVLVAREAKVRYRLPQFVLHIRRVRVVAARAIVLDGRVDADGLVLLRDHFLMATQAQLARRVGHQHSLVGRAVWIVARRAFALLDRPVDRRLVLQVVAIAALLVFRERRLEAMLARLIVLVALQALLLGHRLMHNLVADDAGVAGLGCALLRDGGGLLDRGCRGRGGHGDLEPHRQHDAHARRPPQAGAEIATVASVGPADHHGPSALAGKLHQPLEEVLLAVEAPLPAVCDVVGVVHLAGGHLDQRGPQLLGQHPLSRLLTLGQAGRDPHRGQHGRGPECLDRQGPQQRAVHPGREGRRNAAQGFKDLPAPGQFRFRLSINLQVHLSRRFPEDCLLMITDSDFCEYTSL